MARAEHPRGLRDEANVGPDPRRARDDGSIALELAIIAPVLVALTVLALGYGRQSQVNGLVEAADMKAAQRAYEANLNAIEAARGMTSRTIDLLK